eukprot:CAMPEP_0175630070 /NCGR_PEP_ID=MMETSP0096-20121207/72821_1 /TAXON_ID=311494 /ORGANISM="Alexandrium monilatum, Strain CCMP3105" /LENGTH=38 /DNA_ID= /DNA_START= /DNA_END= /DNA_ORIENTATION=
MVPAVGSPSGCSTRKAPIALSLASAMSLCRSGEPRIMP